MKTVKCINGCGDYYGIRKGDLYQVEKEDSSFYYVKVDPNQEEPGGWFKDRFVVVSSDDPKITSDVNPNNITYQHVIDLINHHMDDWRQGALVDSQNVRGVNTPSILKALQMLHDALSGEQRRRTNKD